MRRVEIWTVYGDHLVFNNVMLAGPSEGERFFCIRRDDRTDYIPAYDIKKAQVVDYDKRERCRSDFRLSDYKFTKKSIDKRGRVSR